MLLIKNIHVFAPEDLGLNDILVAGEKIVMIQPKIEISNTYVKVIDGTGKTVIPGLIDAHVHITGGGGESGASSKAPEIHLSALIQSGITTVVGLLGTDGISRTPANLFSKAKALREEGISAYALTGSYRYPSVTLTGDVQKDIMYIDECIGGKIAISDHRSSMMSDQELSRLASEIRVGGMLSNKAGILTVHMGSGKEGMDSIFRIVEQTDLPIGVFRPTHVNRSHELLEQGFELLKKGGYIDLTCGMYDELSPNKVIKMAKEKQIPLDKMTFSSDGGGSWSNYDGDGNLLEIGISGVSPVFEEIKKMVLEGGFEIEEAITFMTSNVASALKLKTKGRLHKDCDGDLVILNDKFEIDTVIARGRVFMEHGKRLVKGKYE